MLSLLTDREEFGIGWSLVGVAAAVLATATATGWAIPLMASLIVLLLIRARWRTMPTWLLLLWTAGAVIPTETADRCGNGYLVAVVVLLLIAARGMNRAETGFAIALMFSPIGIWLSGSESYQDFGPWTWVAGMGLGWVFGVIVSRQWTLIDELQDTQELLAIAAADAERQRIAREMHDVVGHSFSVVLLHLAGARSILATDPGRAEDALRQAEEVGRRGMDDLRQTIGLLRTGDDALAPVPDAADIDALVDEYRRAGLDIDARLDASVNEVGGAARIVTHEVLRESLTNCAKHAADGLIEVDVVVTGDHIDNRIASRLVDGRPTNLPADGTGLDGLRDRVAAIGGRFSAEPSEHEWVVRAVIPRTIEGAAISTDGVTMSGVTRP